MITLPPVLRDRSTTSDYVLTAVDTTPRYLQMAARWVQFWLTVGAYTARPISPILVTVDGAEHRLSPGLRPYVLALDAPISIHSALVAQVCRLVVPAHLTCDSSVVLTTDIDMLPLHYRYYDRIVAEAQSQFVVGRDVMGHKLQLPICYLAARQSVWREAFGGDDLHRTLHDLCSRADGYTGRRGGAGWNTDQSIAFELLSARADIRRLTDEETGHRRIDRGDPIFRSLARLTTSQLLQHTDYHAHLPATRWGWLHALVHRRLRSSLARSSQLPPP